MTAHAIKSAAVVEPDSTIDELCRELKTCRATVNNWMRAGMIEYMKIGGKAVRFSRKAINDFKARSTVKAAA